MPRQDVRTPVLTHSKTTVCCCFLKNLHHFKDTYKEVYLDISENGLKNKTKKK